MKHREIPKSISKYGMILVPNDSTVDLNHPGVFSKGTPDSKQLKPPTQFQHIQHHQISHHQKKVERHKNTSDFHRNLPSNRPSKLFCLLSLDLYTHRITCLADPRICRHHQLCVSVLHHSSWVPFQSPQIWKGCKCLFLKITMDQPTKKWAKKKSHVNGVGQHVVGEFNLSNKRCSCKNQRFRLISKVCLQHIRHFSCDGIGETLATKPAPKTQTLTMSWKASRSPRSCLGKSFLLAPGLRINL